MHAVRRSSKPARTVASTPGGKLAERTESTSQLDPLIGALVSGRYRIQELIGSGGMGRVYRAIQEPLGRAIALKVVREEEHPDDADLHAERRLVVEASILSQLQHPNIVTLHDYGAIEGAFSGRTFLALELLEGRTLQQQLDLDRRVPAERVVTMMEQVAQALRAAHRRGIVHRDLKPSNIVLVRDQDGDETVKLVDFGIGKILGPSAPTNKLTRTGAVLGTVGYISPEQMQSGAAPASDMFALGVVMFEALTGKPPFDPKSTLREGAFAEPAPLLADVAPDLDVPPALGALVAALLARDPQARPTASETARRLAAVRRDRDVPLPHVISGPVTRARITTGANPPLAVAAVAPARGESLPKSEPTSAMSWMMRISIVLIAVYALAVTFLFSRTPPAAPPVRATPEMPSAVAPPEPLPSAQAPLPLPTPHAKHVAPKPTTAPLPSSPPTPPAPPGPQRTIFNELSTE